MSLLWAGRSCVLYLGISIAVARIRAELGSPVHDLHLVGPEAMLTELAGPQRSASATSIMYSFFWSINRAHRSHPMPNQIEGMKLASVTNTSQRGLAIAMILATAVGLVFGWGILLDAFFRQGGERWAGKGQESFGLLQSWLDSPLQTNWYAAARWWCGLLHRLSGDHAHAVHLVAVFTRRASRCRGAGPWRCLRPRSW